MRKHFGVCQFLIIFVGIFLLCNTLLSFFSQTNLQAKQDFSWLISDTIAVRNDGEWPPSFSLPSSINGNRDCTKHKFVTQNSLLNRSEVSHIACGVETRFGIVDPNGYVQLNNTDLSGKLINFPGYKDGVIPIPYSTSIINFTSAPNGLYIYLTKDVFSSVKSSMDIKGSLSFEVTRRPDVSFNDSSGHLIQIKSDSISFSNNGKWMVADSPNHGIFKVNLETFEATQFANRFDYDTGLSPSLQTAISNDGRFAVISSKTFSMFKIYDLDKCDLVDTQKNTKDKCQSTDLKYTLKTYQPNFQAAFNLKFINDDLLQAFVNYGDPAKTSKAKFFIGNINENMHKFDYLALGDSYISGEGAYSYIDGTDIDFNKCHISNKSYPYLIADSLNLDRFRSIACSGAKMKHITDTSIPYSSEIKPQYIDNSDSDKQIYDNFLPGYRAQIDFVQIYRPNIVTISVSGNDIGFTNLIKRCLEPDTCYSSYEDRLELVRLINSKFDEIYSMFTKVKNEMPTESNIYVIGYPQIAYPQGSCALNVHLNSEELELSNLLVNYFDSVIRLAADSAGVGYVDTENSLSGHRFCETFSSDVAVNGLTIGNDLPKILNGPIANESYHPNALGHELLKDQILLKTNDFRLPMPFRSEDISYLPPESGLNILNAPKTGREIRKINFDDDLTNDVVYRDSWWSIALDSLNNSLKPFSQVSIWLNSSPTKLGDFETDKNGTLKAKIRIPKEVNTGFHTLHIYTQNMAGDNIDIFKTVYLAASQDDLDGDGIANSIDDCMIIVPSKIDIDNDGADDACDDLIGKEHMNSAPQVLGVKNDKFNDRLSLSSTSQLSFITSNEITVQKIKVNKHLLVPATDNSTKLKVANADSPSSLNLADESNTIAPSKQIDSVATHDSNLNWGAIIGTILYTSIAMAVSIKRN